MIVVILLQASLNAAYKKKPLIVVREENGHKEEEEEHLSQLDLDQLIEERDSLYRKAADTKGAHMQVPGQGDLSTSPVLNLMVQGAASYYAARARELNTMIKNAQKEKQMEMFLTINKGCPKTRLVFKDFTQQQEN